MLTVDYIAKFGFNLISFLFILTLHIDCLHMDNLLPRAGPEQSLVLFIKLSTKTYLTGNCYDLNNTEGELRAR